MSSVAAAVADIFEETNSSPYCSAYNISVLWAPRYNIDFSTEYYRKSMESANILLRAEAVNMHPDDALVYPKSIEITIDGVHGTISSIVCDG